MKKWFALACIALCTLTLCACTPSNEKIISKFEEAGYTVYDGDNAIYLSGLVTTLSPSDCEYIAWMSGGPGVGAAVVVFTSLSKANEYAKLFEEQELNFVVKGRCIVCGDDASLKVL